MNVFAGKPSNRTIVSNERLKYTHIPPVLVELAVEHPYQFRGEVIASGVPLQPLKDVAPALLQYLTIDGAQIILPRSEAVDRSLLLNLIELIIDQHRSGEVFDIEINELPQDPVKLIKLHVILELFGLHCQVQNLSEELWLVFETHTLILRDVFWIWGVFGPRKDTRWIPKSAKMYLQMMAWNILNADAQGRLSADLRAFFLGEEGKPYYLTCRLKQHFLAYGLGRERRIASGGTARSRSDTATEHTEGITPLSILAEGPIFPAKWLLPPKPKDLPEPIDIEALFPDEKWDGKRWNHKWDGQEKRVRKMAVERDGLVSLRRSQAFPKNVGMLSAYTESGYVGWCDKKETARKR